MSRYRKNFYKILASLLFVALVSFNNSIFAQDGEALFKANCANCHKPDEDYTGPALKGARKREPSPDWVYKWVYNTTSMVETDPYAKALKAKYGSVMTAQSEANISKADITAILDWADKYEKKAPAVSATNGEAPKEDNSLLFGILTIILAVIAFILLQVNSSLRKLSDEKEGILRSEPVPFYRNKSYLMLGVLALFFVGGYITINAAIGLGRMKNYQPVQPIYYSHKVHAGTNQISCLYCHGGAQDSKQASIPSVNVCMNCHKAIKEYKGDPIVREDGTQVNGTAEIQKLYQYAGWNPDSKTYDKPGRPIEWVKIHNLPDHVYFNHSQHVKVGKQQCQTCHGPIQEMPEVKQFADLSMGWCINCHRESKVNFYNKETGEGNKFYSIYEKFHNDIKAGKMDSVTVEKIGGTECQKCHY
ncbi:c-type cytochrome [Ferruginibacter lapsinanis]|uniref:c-type cytochrome n=1 Tax=Ferruginibacter lapsinanis TaxID=563172 RepID=UPI001E49DC16|nr:c-type cytochrome [Ferruginibacter lapsinanis]UEG50702.1 c-type cytochrome [Ferruginibacter lapsinanis]